MREGFCQIVYNESKLRKTMLQERLPFIHVNVKDGIRNQYWRSNRNVNVSVPIKTKLKH